MNKLQTLLKYIYLLRPLGGLLPRIKAAPEPHLKEWNIQVAGCDLVWNCPKQASILFLDNPVNSSSSNTCYGIELAVRVTYFSLHTSRHTLLTTVPEAQHLSIQDCPLMKPDLKICKM